MAVHIGDAVTHGFVDNRQKGRLVGRIWLRGRSRPLQLDLVGNAHPDLAGRRVYFRRKDPPVAFTNPVALSDLQRGRLGDLTARKKVEVPTLPTLPLSVSAEADAPLATKPVEAFYLEWFTPDHQRLVVELMVFSLRRSRPAWVPTAQEEQQRMREVDHAWQRYLAYWDSFIARLDRSVKDPEEPWDEYDYERFLKVCEARSEKYNELVERYGDSPEARLRIARDMGWDADALSLDEGSEAEDQEESGEVAGMEAMPEPDPAREGRDWIRTPDGGICHPLELRWSELLARVERALQRRLGRARFLAHPEAIALLVQFRVTGSRLTGALRGVAWGELEVEGGLVVACLKRALHALHETHRGLLAACEAAGLGKLQVARLQRELFLVREAILRLMQEYRQR
ncbi:MAG: hypothetical protein RMN51_11180 [Verrucomicrobiota bacterium]|nr:hypothetical protein [Limisphaera sp.]MDW8382650.1 hypothetical protein [Verrucomicrobiota bacterium]